MVVPSLPGYGFSEAPKTPGCGVPQIANIMNQLMIKLGYEKYSKVYVLLDFLKEVYDLN